MDRMDTLTERILASIEEFYRDVDRTAESLRRLHGDRLRCTRGCAGCCIDGITVFEVEGRYIRKNCADITDPLTAHPTGSCAFLGPDRSCRIYPFRPYVCRMQGLPLRWIDEDQHLSPVEMRDICPLNSPGTPVEKLPEESCWHIGPFELRLAGLQMELSGGRMRRVSLKDLFDRKTRAVSYTGHAGEGRNGI